MGIAKQSRHCCGLGCIVVILLMSVLYITPLDHLLGYQTLTSSVPPTEELLSSREYNQHEQSDAYNTDRMLESGNRMKEPEASDIDAVNNQVDNEEESEEYKLVPSDAFKVYDPMEVKVPLPYLKNYRNPCFLQELTSKNPYRGVVHHQKFKVARIDPVRKIYAKRMNETTQPFRVRCLPSFFIAGVQKCGTSDLQAIVSIHDQFKGYAMMENHWWNRGRFQSTKTLKPITMEGYLDLFDPLAENIFNEKKTSATGEDFHPGIIGDESPAVLWDQGFWTLMSQNKGQKEPVLTVGHTIKHILPQAKFLIILRNPTSRTYSDWHFFGTPELNGKLTPSRFHDVMTGAVRSFKLCLLNDTLRSCYYKSVTDDPQQANQKRFVNQWWNGMFVLRKGMYYYFLKDLFDIFPRNQVLIFRLEEYSTDRLKSLQDIYDFLGLDKDSKLEEKLRRQIVHNKRKVSTAPMLPETKTLLDDFYSEHNKKLAELLEDDGYLWH